MEEKCRGMVLNIGDTILYPLHYAVDQVLIAQKREDLGYKGRKLAEGYRKWG